jgi:hypothetical protein
LAKSSILETNQELLVFIHHSCIRSHNREFFSFNHRCAATRKASEEVETSPKSYFVPATGDDLEIGNSTAIRDSAKSVQSAIRPFLFLVIAWRHRDVSP